MNNAEAYPMRSGEGTARKWYYVRGEDFKLTCDCIESVNQQHKRVPFSVYAVYRLVVALYFSAFLIYFEVTGFQQLGGKNFIYLTDWTFIVVTLYVVIACLNTIAMTGCFCIGGCLEKLSSSRVLRYQVQWFFLNVSSVASILITIIYWSTIYPSFTVKLPLFIDITTHLLPSIICLIDILLTTVIIRFVHAIYPCGYLFLYMIFTVIYWAAGGTGAFGDTAIYPIIDYGNYPGTAAGAVFGILLGALIVQAALKGLYVIRHRYIDHNVQVSGELVYQAPQELNVEPQNSDLTKA